MPQVTIPKTYSPSLIAQLAGLNSSDRPWGYAPNPDGENWDFVFPFSRYDETMEVVNNYSALAREQRRLEKLGRLPGLRWAAEQKFTFNGVPTPCDTAARANVTGAIVEMSLPGAPAVRRWKVGPGAHVDFTLPTLQALGLAMAAHVQACFDREEELEIALSGTFSTDEELDAIDELSGWPS